MSQESYATVLIPCKDDWKPLVREMMTYSAFDPIMNPLNKTQKGGQIVLDLPDICLHWSRQTEWPWAVVEAELALHHRCLEVGGCATPFQYAVVRRCRSLVETEVDPLEMPRIQGQIDHMTLCGLPDKITQVRADARSLPFPDNWFDRVFCISVLEHIKSDRRIALEELIRVLAPGGILLLTLDVATENAGAGDNFYVDTMELSSILTRLDLPSQLRASPDGLLHMTKMPKEGTTITVVLIKWIKEGAAR